VLPAVPCQVVATREDGGRLALELREYQHGRYTRVLRHDLEASLAPQSRPVTPRDTASTERSAPSLGRIAVFM
jgi:hypothetical protein